MSNTDMTEHHCTIIDGKAAKGTLLDSSLASDGNKVILCKIAFQTNASSLLNLGAEKTVIKVQQCVVRSPNASKEELATYIHEPPSQVVGAPDWISTSLVASNDNPLECNEYQRNNRNPNGMK
jgi:hypothetical protein